MTAPSVVTEKTTQADVKALYWKTGCRIWDLSQPRATKQTAGLPDLYVVHGRKGSAWWHESKKPGGKQSPAQIEFEELCILSAIPYVIGGVAAAVTHLKAIGVVA